jgi:hypothetical protein
MSVVFPEPRKPVKIVIGMGNEVAIMADLRSITKASRDELNPWIAFCLTGDTY